MKQLELHLSALQARLNTIGKKLDDITADAEQNMLDRIDMIENWKNKENISFGVIDENGSFRIEKLNNNK